MTMLAGEHAVQYGTTTIHYELIYAKRKTLAIDVYPDGHVEVKVPLETPLERVEAAVHKRAAWIVRQQKQYATYAKPNPLPRRYVSGEAYRYLGRQYRLKVVEDAVERVILSRGYLTVYIKQTENKARIAALIEQWSRTQAERVFEERLEVCLGRVESLGIGRPELSIRAMKTRWGSCTSKGRILINPKLIQMPKDLIDYVVLHELCHLKELNHSTAFYSLLDRVLPDWRERRQKLNSKEIV
jgi:predicted metal-dependent hydrolase